MTSREEPRRPEAVVPYHMPKDIDVGADWSGNISTFSAMSAIFLRNQFKMVPWIAGYFGLDSFLNTRKTQKSGEALTSQGPMLAAISLFTFYLNIYLVHRRTVQQQGMSEPLNV